MYSYRPLLWNRVKHQKNPAKLQAPRLYASPALGELEAGGGVWTDISLVLELFLRNGPCQVIPLACHICAAREAEGSQPNNTLSAPEDVTSPADVTQ